MLSPGGRPLVNMKIVVGGATTKAVASISKECSVRIPSGGTVLSFSCINCGEGRVEMKGRDIVGISLRRRSILVSRIIIMKCNDRGGIGLAKTITTVSISRTLTNHSITGISSTLRKLVPKLSIGRDSNVTKGGSSGLLVHNLNAVGGTSPLVIISSVPSTSVGQLGVGSVRDVAMLGSTATSSICNSHTTGNIVLIGAGSNGNLRGARVAFSNSCK